MTIGHTITLSTNGSRRGIAVNLLNRGATIAGITLRGIGNRPTIDVVLGYPAPNDYDSDRFYMGSTVGPVANRLDGGKFQLPLSAFDVGVNEQDRQNALHGGEYGLHQQVFQASPTRDACHRVFSRALPHLCDGFPGDRLITVRYELIDATSLQCDFVATTDRTTVINLANHAYFNLGGALFDHELRLQANAYTPLNERLIPTGTVTDLREEKTENKALNFGQWREINGQSLDHNFILSDGSKLREAASLRLKETNLQLDVLTTQRAMQVYTGDGLAAPFSPRAGICLEAQAYPDAPNQRGFPSIVLEPAQIYRQRTVFRFGAIRGV